MDIQQLEHDQIQGNIGKLMAETMKLNAEGDKLRKEAKWLPVIWATGFVAAVLAVAKFLH